MGDERCPRFLSSLPWGFTSLKRFLLGHLFTVSFTSFVTLLLCLPSVRSMHGVHQWALANESRFLTDTMASYGLLRREFVYVGHPRPSTLSQFVLPASSSLPMHALSAN